MFSHVKKIQVNSALILCLKTSYKGIVMDLEAWAQVPHICQLDCVAISPIVHFRDWDCAGMLICPKSRVLMLCATVEAFVTLNFAGRMTSWGQKSCANWRRVLFEIISLHEARLGCTKISVHKCECSSHKVWRSFFCVYTYMPYELSENHWSCLLQTSDVFSNSRENRLPFLSVQK